MVDFPWAIDEEDGQPRAPALPFSFGDVSNQVGLALQSPEAKAAALSFGLQMLQPRAWGQTTTGQIGEALGKAGESGRILEAQDLKRQEADSKQALRESTATAQEARARAAELAAGRQSDRATYEGERLAQQKDREARIADAQKMSATQHVDRLFRAEVDKINTANAKVRSDLIKTPADKLKELQEVPNFVDWLEKHPQYKRLYEGFNMGQGSPPSTPPAAASPQPATPAPAPSPAAGATGPTKPARPWNPNFSPPAGSKYNERTRQFMLPDGRILDENGKEVKR